jgi:hypothetical protein
MVWRSTPSCYKRCGSQVPWGSLLEVGEPATSVPGILKNLAAALSLQRAPFKEVKKRSTVSSAPHYRHPHRQHDAILQRRGILPSDLLLPRGGLWQCAMTSKALTIPGHPRGFMDWLPTTQLQSDPASQLCAVGDPLLQGCKEIPLSSMTCLPIWWYFQTVATIRFSWWEGAL